MPASNRRKRFRRLAALQPPPGTRRIKLHPEAQAAIEEQLEAFKAKFGREPGPTEPIFFDPNCDTPQPWRQKDLENEVADAMGIAGIEPEFIYAWRRTGLIVTEANMDKLTAQDRADWSEAVASYRRAHPK